FREVSLHSCFPIENAVSRPAAPQAGAFLLRRAKGAPGSWVEPAAELYLEAGEARPEPGPAECHRLRPGGGRSLHPTLPRPVTSPAPARWRQEPGHVSD